MPLDLNSLVAKTELKNKDCVVQFLESQGYDSIQRIDNLPGKYGQPWLCENGTTVVVAELRRIVAEASESMPTIEEAIEVAEPEPEPERESLSGEMSVVDLEIEGVTKRQLQAIAESGIVTLADLFENEDSLDEVPGVGEATKNRILQAVTEALERK